MKAVFQSHWYVIAFVGIELILWIASLGLAHARRNQLARNIDLAEHPSLEPIRGWRLVELTIILYHFPLIVPVAMVRKDQSVSGTLLLVLTPVVYSLVFAGVRSIL